MRAQQFVILLAFSTCPFIGRAQTIANAGPDQQTCLDTTTMQANTPLPTEIGFWTLTSGSATIIDPTDPTTFVTGIDYGQNVLTWTIITPVDTTSDQVRIIRFFAEGVPIDAGPDQSITAPPFSTTMGGSSPIFPQVFTWSVIQGTGLFSNTNDPNATVSDLSEGVNIFQWTTGSGPCIITGMDQVTITVELDNAQTIADAGPDTSLCVNFYTMQGSPLPTGALGQWTLVSGCGTIIDPNSPTTLTTDLCLGMNVFHWTLDDGGTFTSDYVAISVYDPNMLVANAGMDQTIVGPQTSAQLSGSPTPIWPATCSWTILTGSSIIADPNDPNAVASGLGVGENIFVWTCENGPCWSAPTEDTVVVQMMMVNGLSTTEANSTNSLTYDPSTQELRVLKGIALEAMEVTDIRGRSVASVGRGTRSIRMADLPDGIYVARAIMDDRPVVLRFAVTH